MTAFDLRRRLVAEAFGTGILVATVVGSGIMAERLAGGNMALALLGNSLPSGAILVVLITIFGGVSGAHFNPAMSLVLWARKEMTAGSLAAYVAVYLASKKITNAQGQSFTAGKLGKYTIGPDHTIILGPPTVFNSANINNFNF